MEAMTYRVTCSPRHNQFHMAKNYLASNGARRNGRTWTFDLDVTADFLGEAKVETLTRFGCKVEAR